MKQVHWTLPFDSLDGNNYRIDIYADGEVTAPIVLTGAAEPFTTDEDNSDDFFEPVRGQTGQIHIVNTEGLVTLDELIPQNNLDRPVRVVSADDEKVLWMGYLSCEAYSQEYTSRPSEIDLPVNSVLEAMKGEQVPYSKGNGAELKTIGELLGMTGYEHVLMPEALLANYDARAIYNYNWVSEGESLNGSTMTRIREGKSIYEMVSDICTMLSVVAREVGDTLWLYDPYAEPDTMYKLAGEQYAPVVVVSADDIDTLKWHGTGHQYSIRQGVKAVAISSKSKGGKDSFDIVDMPERYTTKDEIISIVGDFVRDGGDIKYTGEVGSDAYKRMPDIDFAPRRVYFTPTSSGTAVQYRGEDVAYGQALDVIYNGYRSKMQQLAPADAPGDVVVGIAAARFALFTGSSDYAEDENGLLLTAVNTEYVRQGAIVGFVDTEGVDALPYVAIVHVPQPTIEMIGNRGWMRLKLDADFITQNGEKANGSAAHPNRIRLRVNHGNWYLHSVVSGTVTKKVTYSWSTTPGYAEVLMVNGKILQSDNLPEGNYDIGDDLVIPSPYILSGAYIDIAREQEKYINIYIYPVVGGRRSTQTQAWIGDEVRYVHIKKLELSALNTRKYEKPETQREYRRVLNAGSDEDQSVDMALCSWNTSLWSMLYKVTQDQEDPEQRDYDVVSNIVLGDSVAVPEQRVLSRMASHYSAPRRTLSLEVKAGSVDQAAVYRGYDERDYIVQSISRDWRADTDTVVMAERASASAMMLDE